jgi:HemX protein
MGDVVWRLPSLEVLERMSHSSVLLGLVTIAIGTGLGFLAVDRQTGQFWFYDPKYIVTLVVLLLYMAYFRLARTTAWRGARASRLCVFNFVVVILSFTVVNLYFSQHHRFF